MKLSAVFKTISDILALLSEKLKSIGKSRSV